MKQILVIRVEQRTLNPREPFRKVLEVQKQIDDNLVIPFENMISSLKFLFGFDSLITFIYQ